MALLLFIVVAAYSAPALMLFTLSALELLETNRCSPLRLSVVVLAALFWPVTVLVMSAAVRLSQTYRAEFGRAGYSAA